MILGREYPCPKADVGACGATNKETTSPLLILAHVNEVAVLLRHEHLARSTRVILSLVRRCAKRVCNDERVRLGGGHCPLREMRSATQGVRAVRSRRP